MKKIIGILILVFWTSIGIAQTDSVRGKTYELKGQIINEVSLSPHCGTIAWGTVIEFKIIEFSNPNYKSDSIGIIVTCPEFYNENFFEVGKVYTLVIADKNQASFEWVIPNKSLLDKYQLYENLWVIEAIIE
jgi:hypothetical protein